MTDCGSVKERVGRFDAENGNFVIQNGWLIFETGAQREVNPLGCLMSPPADLFERAKVQLRYADIKLKLAAGEFYNLKMNLTARLKSAQNQRVCTPNVDKSAIDRLKMLKNKVVKYQRKLEKAQARLEANKPDWLIQREKMNEENCEQCDSLLTELNTIEV